MQVKKKLDKTEKKKNKKNKPEYIPVGPRLPVFSFNHRQFLQSIPRELLFLVKVLRSGHIIFQVGREPCVLWNLPPDQHLGSFDAVDAHVLCVCNKCTPNPLPEATRDVPLNLGALQSVLQYVRCSRKLKLQQLYGPGSPAASSMRDWAIAQLQGRMRPPTSTVGTRYDVARVAKQLQDIFNYHRLPQQASIAPEYQQVPSGRAAVVPCADQGYCECTAKCFKGCPCKKASRFCSSQCHQQKKKNKCQNKDPQSLQVPSEVPQQERIQNPQQDPILDPQPRIPAAVIDASTFLLMEHLRRLMQPYNR